MHNKPFRQHIAAIVELYEETAQCVHHIYHSTGCMKRQHSAYTIYTIPQVVRRDSTVRTPYIPFHRLYDETAQCVHHIYHSTGCMKRQYSAYTIYTIPQVVRRDSTVRTPYIPFHKLCEETVQCLHHIYHSTSCMKTQYSAYTINSRHENKTNIHVVRHSLMAIL
ncbi:hypothetical protein MAR_020966, partial [Mya arenaria]